MNHGARRGGRCWIGFGTPGRSLVVVAMQDLRAAPLRRSGRTVSRGRSKGRNAPGSSSDLRHVVTKIRQSSWVIDVPVERFEELVAEALDSIPEDLGRLMDNVIVQVAEQSRAGLLGRYDGIPLTERAEYGGMAMPDRITIYRLPILDECENEDDVVEQVRITVIHEVAHHFGISDERLTELGWD